MSGPLVRIHTPLARRVMPLAAILPFLAAAAAGATPGLGNGRLSAEFGPRGLSALVEGGTRIAFLTEAFSVSIDGKTYDSAALPAPRQTTRNGQITFDWTAGAHRVSVVYELQPGWRFISKQIAIGSPGAAAFRVDEVAPLRATLVRGFTGSYVPRSARPDLEAGDYGVCLRLSGQRGLLAVVQNPFLHVELDNPNAFSIRYKPDVAWNPADGDFVADRALLGPYALTGRTLPARMTPEWIAGPNEAGPGMDEGEVAAFTEMVRAFVLAKPSKPVNVFVPWCLNDYQVDVATPEGRAEYKRILDSGASLGAEYVIFAPTNSDLAKREDSLDDWHWENLLWLGFGQKIRRNEWDVKNGPVPASVQEMLDYARSKNLRPLAYVYPVLPFSQDPAWLVSPADNPTRRYASLGVRSFQDWLIGTLVAFHDRFGLGGFSFDHTFLGYPGTSRYAQWAGWRRVMEELRRRIPDIVIDGRQAYHLYGPWGWLAGSYPHPTFNDEQPESFAPFPDLHFDRVSADRERYTAYRYKNYEFAPSELVPGFITHQTSRGDATGEMPQRKTDKGVMLLPFRQRDWDHLGWRYSLLSSIAAAGLNNVIDMIPARDPAEYAAFSEADRRWFRAWIDWTAKNQEYLRNTRTILGQPAIGKVDGTSALAGDRGYLFLFNPNGRRLNAEFGLDETIGLSMAGRDAGPTARALAGRDAGPTARALAGRDAGPTARALAGRDAGPTARALAGRDAGPTARALAGSGAGPGARAKPAGTPSAPDGFLLRELYPQEGRLIGNPAGGGPWRRGDHVSLPMDGGSAMVLELQPVPAPLTAPLLFNVKGRATVDGETVTISNASGEAGTEVEALVLAPSGKGSRTFTRKVRFEGVPFAHYQQIGAYDPAFTGGRWSGRFTVPGRIFEQLAARERAWPLLWTSEDYLTTWLAPQRLLLFVQIAEPDDRWEVTLRIDGRTVALKKAYTAVRAARRTFVGFYADLSLIAPDVPHAIELDLPQLAPGQFQGVFFENVETEYTRSIQ